MNILQLAQAYAEAKVVAQAGGDVADVSRAWAALKEAARDAERYRWLKANAPDSHMWSDASIDQAMQKERA